MFPSPVAASPPAGDRKNIFYSPAGSDQTQSGKGLAGTLFFRLAAKGLAGTLFFRLAAPFQDSRGVGIPILGQDSRGKHTK